MRAPCLLVAILVLPGASPRLLRSRFVLAFVRPLDRHVVRVRQVLAEPCSFSQYIQLLFRTGLTVRWLWFRRVRFQNHSCLTVRRESAYSRQYSMPLPHSSKRCTRLIGVIIESTSHTLKQSHPTVTESSSSEHSHHLVSFCVPGCLLGLRRCSPFEAVAGCDRRYAADGSQEADRFANTNATRKRAVAPAKTVAHDRALSARPGCSSDLLPGGQHISAGGVNRRMDDCEQRRRVGELPRKSSEV